VLYISQKAEKLILCNTSLGAIRNLAVNSVDVFSRLQMLNKFQKLGKNQPIQIALLAFNRLDPAAKFLCGDVDVQAAAHVLNSETVGLHHSKRAGFVVPEEFGRLVKPPLFESSVVECHQARREGLSALANILQRVGPDGQCIFVIGDDMQRSGSRLPLPRVQDRKEPRGGRLIEP
jgi:hypothetical protein